MKPRWEVVVRALDEFYATDYTVPARVLRRFRSRRFAERWAYRKVDRPLAHAAVASGSPGDYRRRTGYVDVRRIGER